LNEIIGGRKKLILYNVKIKSWVHRTSYRMIFFFASNVVCVFKRDSHSPTHGADFRNKWSCTSVLLKSLWCSDYV